MLTLLYSASLVGARCLCTAMITLRTPRFRVQEADVCDQHGVRCLAGSAAVLEGRVRG